MAKKEQGAKPAGNQDNVVVLGSTGCMAEGCKVKSQKAGFCLEHFDWFKEGLITRDGRRPSDFDKKHQAYKRRKDKAA